MASLFHVKEHTLPASHIREYARATSNSQTDTLVQHVKQYTPKNNPNPQKGDITIIGAHANGFPKELYEPLWNDLHVALQQHGIRIREILISDCAWQGQSGILNKDSLGNDPSWLDYTRDIVHMVNILRPEPPLVGIGHSFGGAAIVNAALFSPRLFTTVILLDPVISPYSSTPGDIKDGPAAMSIRRRDIWPSRQVAAQSFKKSPFYQSWDERVLKLWLEYGLAPANTNSAVSDNQQQQQQQQQQNQGGPGDEAVTLATTKHQEVFTYLRPSWAAYDAGGKNLINRHLTPDLKPLYEGPNQEFNRTWPFYRPEPTSTLAKLPELRPSTFYIFGGTSNLSTAELRDEKLNTTGVGVGGSGGRTEGRVAGVVEENAGHLVPLESPRFCAEQVAGWLRPELERWWKEENEYEKWAQSPQREKSTVSDEYIQNLGAPSRIGNKEKSRL